MFNKFLYFLTLCLLPFLLNAAPEISLSPSPIVAGEPAYLSLKSNEGVAEIVDVPDVPGIQWLNKTRTTSNVMVINGERFDITQYGFIVEKPGKFSLPSFKIKYGDEEIETQSRDFTARSGALSEIDKSVFLEPKFNGKGKVYSGQSVQLDVYLLSALDIEAKPTSYPQISLDNVLFDNFSSKNNDNERFAPYPYYPPEKIERDGVTYVKTCFMTSFRPMSPGKLKGTLSVPMDIVVPNSSPSRHSMISNNLFNSSIFDDPFFNRDKHISRVLSAPLPELDVLPLPKQPDNTNFLELFGSWDFNITSYPDKLAEGETLTIKVEVSGYCSLETLKAPELSIPGFTSYKPEIQKNQAVDLSGSKSKATIIYLLIPKEIGLTNLNLSFATFNTQEDKYEIHKLKKSIDIAKNNSIQEQVVQSSEPRAKLLPENTKNKEADSILHIRKNIEGGVSIPLWKNYLVYYIILIVLGPLILAISEISRRKKNSSTESSVRKHKAIRRKGRILNELKARKDSDFFNYIDSDVVPFINDVSGFPPGTTSYELTSKLSDKTLSECLNEANLSRYMSGANASSEKEFKYRLTKSLKKLCLITIGFFIFSYSANASSIDDFSTEYNKGNFKRAEEICLANLSTGNPSPVWLYDLGNTFVQEGKLADALIYYQRSLLLDPRNQDTLQNLNYVRRLLFLPELYQTRTPLELLVYLRDILRPDEWLLLDSILIFALFFVITVRRKLSRYAFLAVTMTMLLLIILTAGIFFNQSNSVYSSRNAIIMVRNPVIHSLPADDSTEVKMTITVGDDVRIQDKMEDWSLISSKNNKTIGWVKNSSVSQIWPY